MENKNKITVLYVDDEENNLVSFKATFRLKYKVFTAINGPTAIDIVKKNHIDIIITDQRMPEMTGVALLEEIIKINPDPMRILLTGYADMSAVVDAVNKGKIYHYLSKPWSEEELDETIQRAYEIYAERKDVLETYSKLEVSNEQLEFLLRQKLLS
ncbi:MULTISPECIES: response regulator [Sphingobacterium]|uniref:Response regulator receiver domain-containing protein n=1 Tax=Sphingobacterium nematocida TaxID=1513896 RepID=A0A1T5FRS3_9SPHI|nr:MULTISPECIES: response regulator [Sphingobacterium]SKB98873.1 Response regulator receiver domain-containing protein [Sphingobacterium nematocida]